MSKINVALKETFKFTQEYIRSLGGRHGRAHMVVGFTTTYAIGDCHH